MATPHEAVPRAGSRAPWMDRMIIRGARRPDWMVILGVLAVLAAAWAATYLAGGSHSALPHVFYIPIIAATIRFRFRAVVPTALVAGTLCGPLMPLDTATGAAQGVNGWLVRTAMFLIVGATFALAVQIRERVAEHDLATEVRDAVFAEPADVVADPEVLEALDRVLTERPFHCVYQPIYSLSDGGLIAMEALTRFDTEPRRTPDVWFRTAASAGRGVDLEIAAIELAVAGAADLPSHVLLAVNASPSTLADPRLAAILRDNPGRIFVIEITEHAVVADYRMLADVVQTLRDLGAELAVDDAGAGFASLRHIVHLAPDTIKIDRSLTQGVGSSPLKRALAGALVEFADATGASLVAEGVEDPEDLATWANLGARAVQGYLTGKPGDIAAPAVSEIVVALTRGARLPTQASPVRASQAPQPEQTVRQEPAGL